QPVRFSEGIGQLLDAPLALLEIGPGRTLATLARQHGARKSALPVVATLPADSGDSGELDATLQAVGQLWTSGCDVDWKAFHGGHRRRRVSLPSYPFEGTRCWVDPPRQDSPVSPVSVPAGPPTVPAPQSNDRSNGPIVQRRVEVSHAMTANEALRDGLRQ